MSFKCTACFLFGPLYWWGCYEWEWCKWCKGIRVLLNLTITELVNKLVDFMKYESGPYPLPDVSTPLHFTTHYSCKIHFNISILSITGFCEWLISFRFGVIIVYRMLINQQKLSMSQWIICEIHFTRYCKKVKAIPLQAWTAPEGSRRSRLPDFKTISTWRW